MGRVEVVLDDDLERRLRTKAISEFGGRKGSLVSAVSKAVEAYVSEDPKAALVRVIKDKTTPRAAKLRAAVEIGDNGRAFSTLAAVVSGSDLDPLSEELVLARMAKIHEANERFLEGRMRLLEEGRGGKTRPAQEARNQ